MAHVEKRGPGRYRARYRLPNGKERSKTFRRKVDAQRWLAEVEVQKLRGAWVDPRAGRITFGCWFEDWIETAKIRPSTRNLYEYLHRRFLASVFDDAELSKITAADVRRWRAQALKENVSPNTVAKAYRLLSRVLRQAVDDRLIGFNPCSVKGAGKEESPETAHATPDQVQALANAVPERYRALVLLAGFGGLRWGELAGLRVRRVDLVRRRVMVAEQLNEVNGLMTFSPPKSEAGRRDVTLPRFLVEELETHLTRWAEHGPDGLVFPAADGGPMRRSNFRRRVWHPATKAVGMDGFRFHDLRHSAGTMAAIAGATTRELMARLGHASPRAALIYQHATAERDEVIADKLDALAGPTRPDGYDENVAEIIDLAEIRPSSDHSDGGDDGNRTHDHRPAKTAGALR